MAQDQVVSPVSPVFRIPDMAVDVAFLVERAMTQLELFQADRSKWLLRREEFYLGWDDYLSPAYKGLWEGSSNIHLPTTEIQINQMHARILQSIFFVNPPFFVDPQEDLDEQRLRKIYNHMKYILMRYTNYNKGIFNAVDDWAMDLCTDGMAIFARGWDTVQRRHLKVVENETFKSDLLDLEKMFMEDTPLDEFTQASKRLLKPYVEQMVIRTTFNGPTLEAVDPVNVLFKGMVVDSTDLDRHETVHRIVYFTGNDLMAFKESEYCDEDAIDKILESGPDKLGDTSFGARTSSLQYAKDQITGIQTVNPNYVEDRYEFICSYDTVHPQGKSGRGLKDRLVYLVHPKSKTLPRWTFLDRISVNGKIPLHMGHLFRRPRRSIGRGLVETQGPINDVQDILLNQSIDAGMLANSPMGLYRGNGSFDPEEFTVEPGILFKVDDPNQDIRLLTWPINPNWSVPVQGMLSAVSAQLTSLGPQASGVVSGPIGPLRSTSGLNALDASANVNQDVIFKRVNGAVSEAFEGLYFDSIDRMPESLTISVIGMDGIPEIDDEGNPIRQTVSKAELRAKVHFGLYANSSNMNRQAQLNASVQMSQMLFQRAAMETGVVGPKEIYETLKDMLMNMGKQRIERFIKQPAPDSALPLSVELFTMSQGIMPQVALADPQHEEKIAKFQEILNDPDTFKANDQYGVLNDSFFKLIDVVIKRHQKMLTTLQQAQNTQNPTGAQQSPTLGLQGGQAPQQPNEVSHDSQFTDQTDVTKNISVNPPAGTPL